MTEDIKNKIKISLHQNELSESEYNDLIDIIKNENTDSILSKLSSSVIREYLNLAAKSDHIFLFSCKIENQIIGYALFAKKPEYLINGFSSLKYKILYDLIKKVNFIQLINIIISFLKLDLVLLTKDNKNFIKNSLNLNLLGIKKKYQSQGIGKLFCQNIIENIYQNYFKFDLISVEAPNISSCNFYANKLNFKLIGKKLRLFRIFFVLLKK
tara:strand:+ start:1146 stop:1781 length:636 start_codon:yes stop_codon:yes gene_type:complete